MQYNPDTRTLITLWQASDGNPVLKIQLEMELQNRIQNNANFCREDFFKICKIQSHAITVSFIPTSESYRNYGPYLTIDMILTEEEIIELLKNYSAKPQVATRGLVKAKVLAKEGLTDLQIQRAAEVGFHTNDVFEILHL